MRSHIAANLTELYTLLREGVVALTDSLPTFGGTEPRDTTGVWSWDATHLLVGTCQADLELVPRP